MQHFCSNLLKYFPAFLSGLLVVSWLVSQFAWVATSYRLGTGDAAFILTDGMVMYIYCRPKVGWEPFVFDTTSDPAYRRRYVGQLRYVHSAPPDHWLNSARFRRAVHLPIPMILTVLLPLAIGPFVRYRFPLWSWLAFITLISCELAYYF